MKMFGDVLLDRADGEDELVGDARRSIGPPPSGRSTSRSRRRQLLERVVAPSRARTAARRPRGRAPCRRRRPGRTASTNSADVDDPVLEQVADVRRGRRRAAPWRRSARRTARRRGSPCPAARCAQLERGAEPFVTEGGRQPDVDDRDVRSCSSCTACDERVAVAHGGDHLEAVVAAAGASARRAGARGPRRSRPARQLRVHQ